MANFKHESKNEGTARAMVRYQGHPGLSERGSFVTGGKPGSLFPCFPSSCVTHLAICLLEVDVFDTGASALKGFVSGTHIRIEEV